MQCHEFEARVQELLDERLPPADDGALAAHAAVCAECRASLAAWSAMLEGAAAQPRPVGRADLADRVLAELRPRPAAAGLNSKAALRWAALATAAALLVAATLALWNAIDDRPVAHNRPVADDRPANSVTPNSVPKAADVPAVANLSAEPALPNDFGTVLADAWLLAPGVDPPEPADSATPQTSESTGWGAELAAGLRPLADSTTDAWDFLTTALPAPADSASDANGSNPAGADIPAVKDET